MGTVITYALIGNRGRRRQPPDVAIVVASHAFSKPLQLRAPGSGLTNDLLQVFESSLGQLALVHRQRALHLRDGQGELGGGALQCLASDEFCHGRYAQPGSTIPIRSDGRRRQPQ